MASRMKAAKYETTSVKIGAGKYRFTVAASRIVFEGLDVYKRQILAHNRDLEGVREYLKELKELGPDALIIADPAIFEMAKEICPEIERHVSTQARCV